MTKTSEKIMSAIKESHITPVPRWHFLWKNYVLWGAFFLSVLLGSVSVAMVIESFSKHWDIYTHLKGSFVGFALVVFPYVWIVLLALFLTLAYFDWKYTRGAYRHRTYSIVLGSVALSFLFGITGQALGFGKQFDRIMTHTIPTYKAAMEEKEEKIWNNPDMGTLAGEIKGPAEEEDTVKVEDFKGREWEVKCSQCAEEIKQQDNSGSDKKQVKMIGKKEGSGKFVAEDVKKWEDDDNKDGNKGGNVEPAKNAGNNNKEERDSSRENTSENGSRDSERSNSRD